jgi:hypothetical protein
VIQVLPCGSWFQKGSKMRVASVLIYSEWEIWGENETVLLREGNSGDCLGRQEDCALPRN